MGNTRIAVIDTLILCSFLENTVITDTLILCAFMILCSIPWNDGHRYSVHDTLLAILCSRYSVQDTLFPNTLFTILYSWILRSRYSAPNTYPNGLQLFTYKVERFTGWISSYFSVPVKGDSEAITTRSKFLETKRVDFRFGKCSIARGNWDRSDWQVPRCYWLKNLL